MAAEASKAQLDPLSISVDLSEVRITALVLKVLQDGQASNEEAEAFITLIMASAGDTGMAQMICDGVFRLTDAGQQAADAFVYRVLSAQPRRRKVVAQVQTKATKQPPTKVAAPQAKLKKKPSARSQKLRKPRPAAR